MLSKVLFIQKKHFLYRLTAKTKEMLPIDRQTLFSVAKFLAK